MNRLHLLPASLLCMLMLGCAMPERLLKPESVKGPELLPPYQTETYKESVHLFDAIDLKPRVAQEQWQLAVDHLIVIWDQAGLKTKGRRSDDNRSSLIDSREWLRRFDATLPVSEFPGLLMSTGAGEKGLTGVTGSERYVPHEVEQGLDKGLSVFAAGTDQLNIAIANATEMAVKLPGRSALVVITDWDRLGVAELNALDRFHQRMRHRLGQTVSASSKPWNGKQDVGACVHLVGVGNAFSRERMLRVPNCTSANTFGALAQPRDMARFVTNLMYAGPADDDGDGIPNYLDECPNTPTGRMVTSKGCLRFPTEAEASAEIRKTMSAKPNSRVQ